ncbi:MAG: TIGR03905 family TSCPD domain-containing protein [Clostridia bacterium]
MEYSYKTRGVCSREIHFKVEDGKLTDMEFIGGCNGNLKGISALCQGKEPKEVAKILKGITCGAKSTSCPDQLAKAIEELSL